MAVPAWTRTGLLRAWLLGTTALLPATGVFGQGAFGQTVAPNTLPTGGQVSAGSAAISRSGANLQVHQTSDRAAINWQSFNVGSNASVNFRQPSAASWTLNRVTGPDPSVIAGRISANGGVALVNQSGVVFAAGAQVNVGSLIASAATITDSNFMAGKMVFDGAPNAGATVENHGSITVADRGLVALVGPRVGNTGTIRARLGRVALQGAETYSLDLAGDGLLSIDVTQAVRTAANGATALVTNSGVIDAAGGSVLISAHAASGLVEDLVRNTGRISANTAEGRTGQVALRAEGGGVRVDGSVRATGGATGRGGTIELRGSTSTTVASTARINASGGTGGGTVLVGTTGVGRNQTMSVQTTVERGARIRANARTRGNGGTIAVNATEQTEAKGSFAARGGAQGGNGGLVELSGQGSLAIAAQVDVRAPAGQNGTLLLDPKNIRVVSAAEMPENSGAAVVAGGSGSDVATAPGTTITANTGAAGSVLFVNAADINALTGTVTLQANEGISIQAAVNRAGQTLNLFADGAISQSGNGTITAGTLVIRAFDGVAAAGSASLELPNSIGTLDAKVTGGLSFNNGTQGLIVTNAIAATVTLATTGTLSLQGPIGQAGATVNLNANDTISQAAGGVITAGTLNVRDASGAAANAANVTLDTASNAIGTIDIAATGSVAVRNGATDLAVTAVSGSAVTLTTDGALSIAGALNAGAGDVALHAGQAITDTADGAITAGLLRLRNAAGTGDAASVALTLGSHAVTVLDARSAAGLAFTNLGGLAVARATGSDVTLISGGAEAMHLTGAVGASGATVALTAGGDLTQTASGIITADTLSAGSASGSIALGEANAVSKLLVAGTVPASVTFVSTADLTVGRVESTGLVDLTGKSLTLGSVNGFSSIAADTLKLTATNGGISQAAGFGIVDAAGTGPVALTANASATAPANGSISLLGTGNLIGTLNATATGALAVVTSSSMMVTRAAGSSIALTVGSPGTLAVQASGAGGLGIEASAGISLDADAVVLHAVSGTNGDAAIRSTGGSGTISLRTDALTWAGKVDATATGTVEIGPRTAGKAVELGNAAPAAGALSVNPADFTTASLVSGTFRVGATTIGSAVRGSTLTVTSAVQPTAGAVATALELVAGTDLAVQAVTGGAGRALLLRAAGAITQTVAGSLMGTSLTIRGLDGITGAGSAALGSINNAAAALDAVTIGDLAYRRDGTFIVDQASITGSGHALLLASSDAMTLAGTVGGSGNAVTLQASGAITQNAGSAITGTTLTVRDFAGGTATTGAVTLAQSGNSVTALDAAAGAGLTYNNGSTALSVTRATASAGSSVELRTTGAATLTGSLGGTATTNLSLLVDGAISQPGGGITANTLTIRGATIAGNGAASVALGQANAVITLDAIAAGGIGFSNGATALTVAQARSTTSGAAIGITGGSTLALDGVVGGTNAAVTLTAAGTISQTAGGVITAATLDARATGGAVALATAVNAVQAVTAMATGAGNGVALASGTGLTVTTGGVMAGTGATIGLSGTSLSLNAAVGFTAADAANLVQLTATAGGIGQGAAGVITTAGLNAAATGGAIALASAANAIGSVTAAATGAGNGVAIGSSQGLTVATGGVSAGTGATIALTGSSIGVNGAIGFAAADAANRVTLTATAGDITQTASGLITTTGLQASATAGSVALATAANAIDTLTASATGAGNGVAVRSVNGLTVTTGGVTAGAGGAIDLTGSSVAVNAALGFAAANATNHVTLTATAGGISQSAAGAIVTNTLSLAAATGIALATASGNAFANVAATSTGDGIALASSAAFAIAAGGIQAGAGTTIALTAPGITIGNRVGFAAADAGNLILLTADALSATAAIDAGASGRVRIGPATGIGVELGAATVAGALQLSATTLGNITADRLQIATGGGQSIAVTGPVDLTTQLGTLELISGGGITEGALGGLKVNRLAVSAADGGIALGATANAIGAITGTTADPTMGLLATRGITLTTGGSLNLAAAVEAGAGQTIALTADALTTTAALRFSAADSANTVRLTADGMSLGGAVTAGPGQVVLRPRAGNVSVELGGATIAGALQLSTASLGQISASLLDIAATGTGSVFVTGSAAFRDAAIDAGSAIGGVRVARLVLGGADITDTAIGALNIGNLQATATGTIDLRLGTHAVDALTAQAPADIRFNGSRDLSVATAGAASAARAAVVELRAPRLTLAGDVHGGTVMLEARAAGAGISQAGGTILDAGNLLLTTNGGDATLGNTGNLIDWLSFANLVQAAPDPSLAGTLILVTANDLGLGRNGGAGITAGSIDITIVDPAKGIVARDAVNEVALHAVGTAGGAGRLVLTADSMVLSPTGAGAIGNTVLQATGAQGLVTIRPLTTTHGIQIGGAAPGTALLLASDALGRVSAERLVLGRAGGGSIDIAAAVGMPGVMVLELLSNGSISQRSGATLAVSQLTATAGAAATDHILLDQANAIDSLAASTADAASGLSAGGTISLSTTGAPLTIGKTVTAGGDVGLRVIGGAMTVDQAVTAGLGRSITLRADDMALNAELRATGGGDLAAVNLLPGGGSVWLGVDKGELDPAGLYLNTAELGHVRAGTGTLRIGSDGTTTTATDLVVAGNVTLGGGAAVLDLWAGQVSQTGGIVTVEALTGRAASGFALDRLVAGEAVNAINSLGVTGAGNTTAITTTDGAISIASANALTVLGDVVAASGTGSGTAGVTLLGGAGITIGDAGAPAKPVLVAAGRGDVSVRAAGLLTLRSGTTIRAGDPVSLAGEGTGVDGFGNIALRGSALALSGTIDASRDSGGRDVTLTADTGGIGFDGAITARRNLAAVAADGLAVNGVALAAGGSLALTTAAGDLTLNGANVSAGASVSLTAGSTVAQGGNLAVTGGMLDTGAALALSATRGTGPGGHAGTITLGGGALLNSTGQQTLTAGGGLTANLATLTSTGSGIGIGTGVNDIALTTTTLTAGAGIALTAGTDPGGSGTIALSGSSLTAGGSVALTALAATGDITQTGGSMTAGTTMALNSGRDITQLAGGRLVTPVLSGSAGGTVSLINGVSLPGALAAKPLGNSIASIAGFTSGGDLLLASTATPLQITGLVSAGSGRALRLFADDFALTAGLAAPAGSITLSPYTRDGSIALVLGGASGSSAANTITLDSAELDLLPVAAATSLRFGRKDNPAGLTDLASIAIAGRVDLADPATGANAKITRLELNSRAGITEAAGARLVVPALAATAGTGISLDPGTSGNRIETLAGIIAPGGFTLRNGAPSVAVQRGSLDAADAGSGVDAITVGDGQTITLRVQDLVISDAVRAPGGTIEILPDTEGRGITLGGTVAGTLSLSPAELLLLGGKGGAEIDSGAATLLRIGGNAMGPVVIAGDIGIIGAVDLQGPTARFQALELLSAGSVNGSGGSVTVPALRAAVAGDVILDNAANSFLVNAITTSGTGRIVSIAQALDLRLANAVASLGGLTANGGITAAGGTVLLSAGGTISQDSGALISTGTLNLASAGQVTLGEANAFATLGTVSITGAANSIRGTGYTVAGPVSVTGDLALLADTNLGITGSIGTTGALALNTSFGDIGLNGAIVTAGAGLTATAGTDASQGGTINITGGTVGVTGAIALTAVSDNAGLGHGTITLTGTTLTASTTQTLNAGGGLTATGATLAATAGAFAATAAIGNILFDGSTVTAGTSLGATASLGSVTQRRGSLTGAGDVSLTGHADVTVTAAGGASPVLRSLTGGVTLAAMAGDVVLDTATLTAATTVALAAGSNASQGGDIGITGGTMTAGTSIGLTAMRDGTGANPGTITLADTTLTAATSQTLIAGGGITATSATLAANGGAFAATTTLGDLVLDSSSVTASAGLALTATTGGITQRRGMVSGTGAGLVSLQAGSAITVTADGGTAPVLRATSGALSLATAAGDITLTSAAVSAGAGITATAGTNATQGGDIAVTNGSMTAGGALALTAVQGGANAGTITLANTSLTGATSQTLNAGGGLSATSSSLTATSGAFAATTAAGALLLDRATVTAGTSLDLEATIGSLTQRRGSVSGSGAVTLRAGAGIIVTADGGAAPVLRSTGAGLAATSMTGDISIIGATVSAATALGLTATAGAIAIDTATVTAGTTVSLAAGTSLGITGATIQASTGALTATASSGAIAIANAVVAAATSEAMSAGGAIGVSGSTLTAGADQSLTAGGAIGVTASILQANGGQVLAAGGDLTLATASVTAGGSQALTAGGAVSATATTLAATTSLSIAAGTGLNLATTSLSIAAGTGLNLATSGVTAGAGFAATTSLGDAVLTDSTLAATGPLALTATAGAITQTRGSIIGTGDTTLLGATGVTLTDAGSGVQPVLRSTTGALAVAASSGDVALRNTIASGGTTLGILAGGRVTLTDSQLTTAGRLNLAAGGTLAIARSALLSTAGEIDLTAGGDGTITASALLATAASGRVRFVTGGALGMTGLVVNADVADFEAGRPTPTNAAAYGSTNGASRLTTDGVTASIGTKILFAGPGGVTNLGMTVVTPRGTVLPAVLYDTRITPGQNPLDLVQPDIAGVVYNQQPTQVRAAPASQAPGVFGLANEATAAGNVRMNVNAGQSAVFLLVDGGNIEGNIVAGRLGVHGAGGTMSLFGTLNGSQGAEAARFADITRPIDPNRLQKYRINGCVVGSVNCVVPPSVQIIPPRPTDRAAFTIENNRLNPSDVLIPNIAEEDDDE